MTVNNEHVSQQIKKGQCDNKEAIFTKQAWRSHRNAYFNASIFSILSNGIDKCTE